MCYTNWIKYFEGMIQIWIFELIHEHNFELQLCYYFLGCGGISKFKVFDLVLWESMC